MSKKHWTSEELDYLKSHYASTPITELCSHLQRTEDSIQRKANYLGLLSNRGHTSKNWTQVEDDLLRSIYATTSKPEMREVFKKSDSAIYHRANRLGLEKTKYDSPKRPYMHKWVNKICLHCNKEFRIKRHEMYHKTSPRDYCSRECFYQSRQPSKIEVIMREAFQSEGWKFEEQYPFHYWFLDFAILWTNPKIAIECDGDYWHSSKKQKANDSRKEKHIAKQGDWILLRFSETTIHKDLKGCISQIKDHILQSNQRHPG